METRYPWDGSVQIRLEPKESREFGLHLRIPAWCKSSSVRVNGAVQARAENVDGYIVIRRRWQPGDIVELDLDMPVQRIVGHPFAGAIRERVVIQRGPIIYCLEGVDNEVKDPIVPANAEFQALYQRELLGGVVAITAKDVDGREVFAVPYYTWDNRAVAEVEQDWLLVWLRQEDWFSVRQPLDKGDRKAWEHILYQPLPPNL
jgi:hypothetical protein